MAYMRKHRIGKAIYLYVMESYRRGGKVRSRTLQYLGRADRITPARLREAIRYWRVGTRAKARKAKGGKR